MDPKKLEEANKKFEKQKKKQRTSEKETQVRHEGMKGKDLRKNLGCG